LVQKRPLDQISSFPQGYWGIRRFIWRRFTGMWRLANISCRSALNETAGKVDDLVPDLSALTDVGVKLFQLFSPEISGKTMSTLN